MPTIEAWLMTTARRIVLFLWLVLLGAAHASAVVFHAPEDRIWEFFNIGYDAIDHTTVDYDGPEKLSSAYDVSPSRAQIDSERRGGAQGTSFALFGRLLAANSGMKSGGDRLLGSLGPAHLNNADELAAITADLRRHGVAIDYRAGQYAYGPRAGEAGNLVIDPNASISAWRHEYGHFLDDLANGQPGLGAYMQNPRMLRATERSQYLGEIRTARQIGDETARRQLTLDYLDRKAELFRLYGK